MTQKKKIVVAVTGASGSIYAQLLLQQLEALSDQIEEVGIVLSDNAKEVWEHELGDKSYSSIPFKIYDKKDFYAPFASGSAKYGAMIICPCSMGTLGRIANGISDDLITRAADVFLKQRKQLILVTRETPLSLIHINNLKKITEAGAIICPANPSFYSLPKSIEELVLTVVDRVIDLVGLDHKAYRWGK